MHRMQTDLKIKIVGVGKVGMSIVQAFAQSGFHLQGIDVDPENIQRGLGKTQKNLENMASKGKLKADEKEGILSRIDLSTGFDHIGTADVVIEAVFEDMALKKETFKKFDKLVSSEDALFLTNTSSLSVSELASVPQWPEMVCVS